MKASSMCIGILKLTSVCLRFLAALIFCPALCWAIPQCQCGEGEIQCRGLGMAVEIWDEQGRSVTEQKGELVCVKPFPSAPIYFWNDPENKKYLSAYFETYANIWAHGDYGEITAHNGVIIHGRSDAVLNSRRCADWHRGNLSSGGKAR